MATELLCIHGYAEMLRFLSLSLSLSPLYETGQI